MQAHSLKPNWLLLRGLSRESGHWGEFVDDLQQSMPQVNIIPIDLPGTGQYYQQTSPCQINEITDYVRKQALEQGLLTQPVMLLAISMGGMVAWEWMISYPMDVAGAVLINTSFASVSPFYQRLRWQSYAQFASILMQRNLYQRELNIIKLVCNQRDQDQQRALIWQAIQQQRPVSLANFFRQIIAAARYKNKSKPQQSVLLLNSQGDRLVASACSLAIHKHWQIPLVTHASAGHDLCLDDAEWVIQQLKEWQIVNKKTS